MTPACLFLLRNRVSVDEYFEASPVDVTTSNQGGTDCFYFFLLEFGSLGKKQLSLEAFWRDSNTIFYSFSFPSFVVEVYDV